jgi:hypothetical protein
MMSSEEKDPDTLQLLDETNSEWVKNWCAITKKKRARQKKNGV